MKKTIAIGIIALQHDGGLLKRFVGEVGVLPGTTVMVPQDCWCVLVAGEQATAIFDVGPHELQLNQFNRNPSGMLYTVGKNPESMTWYPPGTPFRRDLTVKVANPLLFVTESVVKRHFDGTGAVVKALRENFDALVGPGQVLAEPEITMNVVAGSLGQVGLTLVDLAEQPAVAPEVAHQAPAVGQPPPMPRHVGTTVGTPPPPPPRVASPPGPSHPPQAAPPAGHDPAAALSYPPTAMAIPGQPPMTSPPPGSPRMASPPVSGLPTQASSPPGYPSGTSPGSYGTTPPVASAAHQAGVSEGYPPPGVASAPGSGPTPQMSPEGGVAPAVTLQLTQVWSSSTMELFGKGELTLRVRILGRPLAVFQASGPFSYDQTREFLSPDDWLGERKWQPLPAAELCFPGLRPDHFYRAYVLAEERDQSSVDALGTLEWELGMPRVGELEIGPTRGGKRGQYVKLKVQIL